jgi:hypothetical protein
MALVDKTLEYLPGQTEMIDTDLQFRGGFAQHGLPMAGLCGRYRAAL